MSKFPVLGLAVAAGLFLSLHAVIITACALAGVPYGYPVSGTGIVMGAILGFSEGFFHSASSV